MIAEWFVAVAHRIPETVFARVGNERVALGGVAGDAVEHGADHPAGRDALLQQRRVHRQLDHDQLVDRHRSDPFDQPLGARVEVLGVGRLDRQPPFGGLRAGDAITSQQKAFRALVA
jgi:hypothetical protein